MNNINKRELGNIVSDFTNNASKLVANTFDKYGQNGDTALSIVAGCVNLLHFLISGSDSLTEFAIGLLKELNEGNNE